MRLLLSRIIDVLDPEVQVARKLPSRSVENEENSPLTAVPSGSHTESFRSLLAEGVEVHLILNISYKIHWLCATRIELVFEI